jgi:hypothetical protein
VHPSPQPHLLAQLLPGQRTHPMGSEHSSCHQALASASRRVA